ncbi:MAG: hypothetical protein JF612_13975 [Planctomycetia bacterium]|nr:hypothetical protein [Planctomycetia bacterium]
MKRAFYEWGAITTSALALFCFGYWVVLLYAPRREQAWKFPTPGPLEINASCGV